MFSLGIVTEAFYGIVLTLDTWVYGLISSAYKIFMAIASARILSSDAYTSIANKVYIIVGVGMLFVLAYAILKAIIDPDQLSKGDMAGSKILKSIAITVIGLIVTPLIFDLAYMAQGKMLEEDILGKLFFRTGDSTVDVSGVGTVNYDEELEHTGGGVAATSVWMAFFYPAEGVDPEDIIADPDIIRLHATATAVGCAAAAAIAIAAAALSIVTWGTSLLVGGAAVGVCAYSASTQFEAADDAEAALGENEDISLVDAYNLTASGASFGIYQGFIEPLNDDEIKYTWFVSTVCGGFVAYAFVSYAIDMGLRAAKLAYYQIIAPIPLILNVMPKNGDRIGKFVKAVFSTFLEVFVRISVVYIVIYIIAHLQDLFSTLGALWDNEHLTDVESLITMALLIIGLVLFAKQAPKIISDTFGLSSGGALEGLNIMKKLRDGEVFTAGSVLGSTIKSGVQGGVAGWKRTNGSGWKKALGAARSAVGSAGSGAARSTTARFRNGKPVSGYKDMKDNIETTTRKVTDKRKAREEFLRQHPNEFGEGGQVEAMWGSIKDKAVRWATGDRDMSKYKADMSFAGNFADLKDFVQSEAEKKDNLTKMWAKREKDLIEQELSQWREGYNEDTYYQALAEMRKTDRAYIAAAGRVDEVTAKRAAMENARKAHEEAVRNGASATEISRLERDFRAREAEYMMVQPEEAERRAALQREEQRIIDTIDAKAKLSDEEFTQLSMEHQAKIKAARDRKETAAAAYGAAEMRKVDSVIHGKVQEFLNDNQEYITANSSRELVIIDQDGVEQHVRVGQMVSDAFGESALKGKIDQGRVVQGNKFVLDFKRPDGTVENVTYTLSFNDRGDQIYTNDRDGTTLNKDQFALKLSEAIKAEGNTRINVGAKQGKDAKRSIPNSQEYLADLKAARKEEKK